MRVRLFETFRAVFYTPFYLPHVLGAYAAEGLDVTLSTTPDLASTDAQLRAMEADLCWGGPMRLMTIHDRDPDCGLVGFCEAVTRDPFFLVGREPNPAFTFADLTKRRLGTVSEVPTPWMCLQDDLRRVGIDPDRIDRVTDGTMAENAAALRAGDVDVVQLFQPLAEELVAAGAGHYWYAAATRGPCSYTTFYTLADTLARRPEMALGMTRAMYRTQKWLHAHAPAEIAAAVAEFFPDCGHARLEASISLYRQLGVWGCTPVLPRAGFERLRAALLSGGLIRREIQFEACVDNRFAEQVVAEDPPSI